MRYLFLALALTFAAPTYAQDVPAPEGVEAAAPEADEAPAKADEAPAKADEAPAPTSEQIDSAVESVSMLTDALENKNWALAIGILLSILVSVANRFGLKDKVGSKALPWVTSGVAVFGAIGAALMAGVPLMEAASQGLLAGVAAIGGWEMVLKHILTAKKAEPAAE